MQIKKPSTLSVGVVVGSGVRWQSGVFISFFIFAFYYHHHNHHQRNALALVDVVPTYIPREPSSETQGQLVGSIKCSWWNLLPLGLRGCKRASHGQWLKVTYVRFPHSTLKYLPTCCSQQSCLLQQTCINGNPQLVKPCIQSFAYCTECTNYYY